MQLLKPKPRVGVQQKFQIFLVFLCGTCILLASEIERKIGRNKFEMYKIYGEVYK
jgi:hypothetical protein